MWITANGSDMLVIGRRAQPAPCQPPSHRLGVLDAPQVKHPGARLHQAVVMGNAAGSTEIRHLPLAKSRSSCIIPMESSFQPRARSFSGLLGMVEAQASAGSPRRHRRKVALVPCVQSTEYKVVYATAVRVSCRGVSTLDNCIVFHKQGSPAAEGEGGRLSTPHG